MTNQYRTDKPNDNEQNDDNTQKSFESGRRRKNMRDYGIKKSNYYKNNYDYDNRDYYNKSNSNKYYEENEHRPKKIITKKNEGNKEEKTVIGPQPVTVYLQLNGASGLKDLF